MANNLKDHLKEVADAIRAKKGTTDLINPQDFATEIEGISGGGSGESGSSWRYFDTTKATVSEASIPLINIIFSVFKTKYELYTAIMCEAPTSEGWEAKHVVATATDFNLKICNPVFGNLAEIKTIEEVVNSLGGVEALEQELGFTEITKEQFYDLNA